jgi:uncharacterized protein
MQLSPFGQRRGTSAIAQRNEKALHVPLCGWLRRRRLLLAATGMSVMPQAALRAQSKTVITLGTATPGGGFPLYGAAFADTVAQVDSSLSIQTRNTKGSTENIPLIEAGELDIALVTGEPLYEAINGIGRAKADLKIITAMYSTPGMFVTRRDQPYRVIADLLGKPVAFGAQGSGLVILARYVLDGLGYDMNRDFQAVFLERAADGPTMVQDGRVAALWGGGSGWPGFAAVANASPGARFIVPDAAQIAAIVAKHTLLRLIARPSLSQDVAYRLAKALHRGEGALGARLAQARETTAANTLQAMPSIELLHGGVRAYLRDAGLL